MPRQLTLQEKHPELYVPEQNIDRRTCVRVVPMEVLNMGMSRTGTRCMMHHGISYGRDGFANS